ncbi:hypothetical protein Ahy_B01g054474 [Arachis hypogaea]|uniref:Uncharacterized protein n=1 Tax=Arachis hypogaea TaxID=3818 RepID=A0A445ATX1_ARAHY|nr:hypothetical protein Ahy_B01g054474 [Arachis hypogaea]
MKRVEKLLYRISISVLRDDVKYDSIVIGSDEDLQGGSNRNPQPPATVAYSTSRYVCASSSVPVIAPETMLVASPSFATDLNCSGGGEEGIIDMALVSLQGGVPDGIDDVLRDDDVEPGIITDDSGDDIAGSKPAGGGRASSSRTQQYPPHFSNLDLDAMRQQGVPGKPIEFGTRDNRILED